MNMTIDNLLTETRAKNFHSFHINFGCSKMGNGRRETVIVVNVFHTKTSYEAKAFKAETWRGAFAQFKEWLTGESEPIELQPFAKKNTQSQLFD